MALRVRKVSGAMEKWAPGSQSTCTVCSSLVTVPLVSFNSLQTPGAGLAYERGGDARHKF